nr:hypothetical protein [Tanacetum cinerariifolium]
MGGLKSKIADGIRMFKPMTMKEVTNMARMRDEQLSHQKKTTCPTSKSTYDLTSASGKSPSLIKRLTWDEMQKRRSQDQEDARKFGYDEIDISLHALIGWATTRTMQVYARINLCLLVVLIDSGSTHNFINEKVAEILSILVVPTKPFNVKVANGLPLSCQGRFENVEDLSQGIPFSLSLYSLPLIGLDMVLGVQWLEQLGEIVYDWKEMTMEFSWENQCRRSIGI